MKQFFILSESGAVVAKYEIDVLLAAWLVRLGDARLKMVNSRKERL
jgi:hypothetical protein